MDGITLDRIQYLHPQVRKEAYDAYQHVTNRLLGKGVRLRFAQTLRTFDEQQKLYAQGRTKLTDTQGNHLSKVTNAQAGQSIHNYGLAFDIVLLVDKDRNGNFETISWDTKSDEDHDGNADWMEVVSYFKKLGWQWGGDWHSFPDCPHFEKTFGNTWQTLLSKSRKGETFDEAINGDIYRWVKI